MSGAMRSLSRPWVVRAAQLLIGGIFIVASLAKLGDLHSFAEQVHNFRLLPLALQNLVAICLPWIELLAGLALLSGFHARSGGLVVAVLMVGFTAAVLIAMARGLDIECGCFGTADGTRVGLVKVLQNLGMLALGLMASVRGR